MSLMDLLIEWTQIEKESLSQMIYQWNPQKTKKKKKKENKDSKYKNQREIQGLRDRYKRCNIYIMGISEEGGEKGAEGISEIIMTKSFHKLMSDTKLQIQEAHRTPCVECKSQNKQTKKLLLHMSYSNYGK